YVSRTARVFTVPAVVLTQPTVVGTRPFSIASSSSVFAGGHAGCPAECAIKTGLRRESAAEGNIAQGLLAVRKQGHCALQPFFAHIAMRCNTHRHAEHASEVGRTETGDASQLSNRNILVEILRDVVQNATQPDFVKPRRSMSLRPRASRFRV